MARNNPQWEPSKVERYAERYWLTHGYEVKLLKRYISKSVYEISKGGLTHTYEVPDTVANKARFMDEFERYWKVLVEYVNMQSRME